jgi:hypothetical protein
MKNIKTNPNFKYGISSSQYFILRKSTTLETSVAQNTLETSVVQTTLETSEVDEVIMSKNCVLRSGFIGNDTGNSCYLWWTEVE